MTTTLRNCPEDWRRRLPSAIVLIVSLLGCTPQTPETPEVSSQSFDARPPSRTFKPPSSQAAKPAASPSVPPTPPVAPPAVQDVPPPRTLGDLADAVQPADPLAPPALPEIDDAAVQSLGIRKLSGKHLALYTDIPSEPTVDELPAVFDAAVPQWCRYFAIPLARAESWRVVGFVMRDKDRFRRARLLPEDLPEFLHGYARGAEVWLHEQPSPYYRRHLLLHEGTHAFMNWSLEGAGPPWYMEGTAELLATHRWQGQQLSLRYFPQTKEEVPEWGRIKIIQDDYRAGQALRLVDVLGYDARAHLRVEPYGWCWAAAAFLDHHPAYRERFRNLRLYTRDASDGFTQRFLGWFTDDRGLLWREWQWYVMNLEYGFDVEREAVQRTPAAGEQPGEIQVAADRGWQSTGIQVEAGKTYDLIARGRFQLATEPKIWWSERAGVTLRYHRGLPLGRLLGAVVADSDPQSTENGFLQPIDLGEATVLSPEQSGSLYLRINDSPSELDDNAGLITVRITPQ